MARIYKTAQGKPVDIDSLRLTNEETIAVGNMKVNARGDQLGPGGTIVKNRNQVMDQHYKLHTPMAADPQQAQMQARAGATAGQGIAQQPRVNTPTAPVVPPGVDPSGESFDPPEQDPTPNLRGTLADSIAKEVTVQQTRLTPLSQRNQNKGPTRI